MGNKASSKRHNREKPNEVVTYNGTNHAVVFIKPHACNPLVEKFVREFLLKHKVLINRSEVKDNEVLRGLIDDHYSAISKAAVKTLPKNLKLTSENKTKFKEAFGVEWDQAVEEGRVLNLPMYERYHSELKIPVGKTWDHHETKKVGVASGIKVARLPSRQQLRSQLSLDAGSEGELDDEESIVSDNSEDDEADDKETFVINGFYDDLRKQYVEDGSKVIVFLVHFKETEVSWARFRQEIIGSTNPQEAKAGSLRQQILLKWKELGLDSEPNYANNGVHASAGPIEGLHERLLWFGTKLEEDPFGSALLKANVDPDIIETFLKNKRVTLYGHTDTTFNFTEELDSSECIRHALDLQKEDPEHLL